MRLQFQKSTENYKSSIIKETSLQKYYQSYKKARTKITKSGKRVLADELDYEEFRNFYQNLHTLKKNKLIDLEQTANSKLISGQNKFTSKARLSIAQYIAYSQTQNFTGAVDAMYDAIRLYAKNYPDDAEINEWLTYTKEYISANWSTLADRFKSKVGGDDRFDDYLSPKGNTITLDEDGAKDTGMFDGLSK